jgi:hypothetical protein
MPLIPSWSWAGWRGEVDFGGFVSWDPDYSWNRDDGKWIKLGEETMFPMPTTIAINSRTDGLVQPVTLEFEAQAFPAEDVLFVTQSKFHSRWERPLSWFLSYEFADLDDLLLQYK